MNRKPAAAACTFAVLTLCACNVPPGTFCISDSCPTDSSGSSGSPPPNVPGVLTTLASGAAQLQVLYQPNGVGDFATVTVVMDGGGNRCLALNATATLNGEPMALQESGSYGADCAGTDAGCSCLSPTWTGPVAPLDGGAVHVVVEDPSGSMGMDVQGLGVPRGFAVVQPASGILAEGASVVLQWTPGTDTLLPATRTIMLLGPATGEVLPPGDLIGSTDGLLQLTVPDAGLSAVGSGQGWLEIQTTVTVPVSHCSAPSCAALLSADVTAPVTLP